MLRSKLAYFRNLLAFATLNEEQRISLQQFATELQTTMNMVMARGAAFNEAAADAATFSPRSLSEDDITNIPLASLASPASTSSWDGSLSVSSEYSAEPAAFLDEAASFDFIASSFGSPVLPASSQASQGSVHDDAVMPAFDQNVLFSPDDFLSMQAGPSSDVHASPEAHVPNAFAETADNTEFDFALNDGLLHELWPHGNIQWANPPLGSPPESNTMQSFASPPSQMSPWGDGFASPRQSQDCTLPSLASMGLLSPSLYGSEVGARASAYDGTTRTMPSEPAAELADVHATGWQEPQGLGTHMSEAVTRLHTMEYNVEFPLCEPESTSWSSNMSECSVIV